MVKKSKVVASSLEKRDYVKIALEFAKEAVIDIQQKTHCNWVRRAAKRHLDDLKKKDWGYRFDDWHANDVCDFIEKLPHVEGSWDTKNIRLEPPQIFILVVVFGWRRKSDGGRRFNYVYIEMARKNAKSTLTAGVALYCLTCDGEIGPQVIIGATTGEQAGKVFNPAKAMVDRTHDLQEAFSLETFVRSIACNQNNGFIQTINSKGKTQDGWNPHLGVLDELHAHKDRGLFDVIRSAIGSRSNPLTWIITTAGYNLGGVCYAERTKITKVLEGSLEAEHMFGIIFTLDAAEDYGDERDRGDDPFDETKWIKANPMLGITPSLSSMRQLATEAKAGSTGEFETKRCNLWLGAARGWINIEKWKLCADSSLDWKDFVGLDCYAGGDLSDRDDITALVLAGIRGDTILLKPKFYLPEAMLKSVANAEGRGAAPYSTWHKKGFLHVTPGDWIDHNEVEATLRLWDKMFSLRNVTMDQFSAAQSMVVRLNDGRQDEDFARILFKNAKNVTDAAKDFETRIKAGPLKLIHDGNPIATWMVSNVVVTRRVDGSILPKKEDQESANKIDYVDAAVNAIHPFSVPQVEDDQDVSDFLAHAVVA